MEAVVTLGPALGQRSVTVTYDEAFPGLFRDAYRTAFRLLGERAAAEDVAQEACARAFSRWPAVHGHATPWCVRVAANLALDQLRARTRGQRRAERLAHELPSLAAGAPEDRIDLYAALRRLPRRQREVVVLRYLGGLSEHDTAAELGVSVGSVKTHASRGLGRLREVLAP